MAPRNHKCGVNDGMSAQNEAIKKANQMLFTNENECNLSQRFRGKNEPAEGERKERGEEKQ